VIFPKTFALDFLQDIPYKEQENKSSRSRDHLLDIYLPTNWKDPASETSLQTEANESKLHAVVFYVHGGGFRILSKDGMYPMVYLNFICHI
jgi:hypothetical protein